MLYNHKKNCSLLLSALIVYGSSLFAQQQHSFFVKLSPCIQQSLRISETPVQNLKHSPNWGASFYFGYEHRLKNKLFLQAQLGGTLYTILFNSGKNQIKLNMPGIPDDGSYDKIFYRDYYYSFDAVVQANYHFDLPKNKKLKVGLGVKLLAVNDYESQFNLYHVADFNPSSLRYRLFHDSLDFVGGIKKPGLVLSASYPISKSKDKFEVGLLVTMMSNPMAKGEFVVENTYVRNSNGTMKLYGSYIGVDFRYNFKKK